MATKKKLLQAAAGTAAASGGAGALNVEDVFSTYLYEGNGSANVIDNGINLGQSNDGGSVDFANSGSLQVTPSDASLAFTGAFTWEAFVFFKTGIANNETIFEKTNASDTSSQRLIFGRDGGDGKFRLWITGTDVNPNTSVMNAGTWYHVALTKDGSNDFRLFINGNLEFTYNKSGVSLSDNGIFTIGQNRDGAEAMQGIISNVRIINGTALYTSSFTAPTAALTDVTNTKLLTCQGDDPLVDNSANSLTVVNNGAKASSFGPFTAADAGEGGLVWIKSRTDTKFHILQDTERGAGKSIHSNNTNAESGNSGDLVASFNSNGFSVNNTYLGGANASTNGSSLDFASWTFRKAPKFFDVVTFTVPTGGASQTISHNLDAPVGFVITKLTSSGTANWYCFHTSRPNKYLSLDLTSAEGSWTWSSTNTEIDIGAFYSTNFGGETGVAYFFAHNDGDGDFGPTGDQDIIKCGSYTGTGSSNFIDLGFEPQWVLVKKTSGTAAWELSDNMRGLVGGYLTMLEPNSSSAEVNAAAAAAFSPNPTGMTIDGGGSSTNQSGASYIYIAIRRGPMAVPTDATDVFAATDMSSSYLANTGFPVDLSIDSSRVNSSSNYVNDRLRGSGAFLATDSTAAEASNGTRHFDSNDGVIYTSGFTGINWSWKRAPSFFDVVAYTGNGTAGRTVSHNLGVAPEMMWVKKRNTADDWAVYHSALGNTDNVFLNDTQATASRPYWNNTTPTDASFTLGSHSKVNNTNDTYIAYLFASLDGVSKVGSYTGNGTSQTIDCGFSSGARFVLIKRTDDTADWIVYDTARGIVTGNEPHLYLNRTDAEVTNDLIDPDPSGFIIDSYFADWNASGGNYIFYAIA